MKALKVIKKVILSILAVAFFSFVLLMTIMLLNRNEYGITKIDNTSFVIISDDISSLSKDAGGTEKYKKGDLVLVKAKRLEDIKENDELFAYRIEQSGKVVIIDLGKVGEKNETEKNVSFANGNTYSMDFVIGEASETRPGIGSFLSLVLSQWGFLFMILLPSFLIFIYQLYALIIEIKYNKDEPKK